MAKKLTKSSTDVVLTGTLGGIAEYFGIDATIIRIIYAVLIFVGYGSPVLLYILLAMIIPKENKKNHFQQQKRYEQGQPFYNRNQEKKATNRKEAEKINDDDQWSDF